MRERERKRQRDTPFLCSPRINYKQTFSLYRRNRAYSKRGEISIAASVFDRQSVPDVSINSRRFILHTFALFTRTTFLRRKERVYRDQFKTFLYEDLQSFTPSWDHFDEIPETFQLFSTTIDFNDFNFNIYIYIYLIFPSRVNWKSRFLNKNEKNKIK